MTIQIKSLQHEYLHRVLFVYIYEVALAKKEELRFKVILGVKALKSIPITIIIAQLNTVGVPQQFTDLFNHLSKD